MTTEHVHEIVCGQVVYPLGCDVESTIVGTGAVAANIVEDMSSHLLASPAGVGICAA